MKTNNKKVITVIGCGYVGLSLAILFSLKNKVFAIDINKDRINNINNRINYIKDDLIDEYFKTKKLNLIGTNDYNQSISKSDYAIICVPTNYDKKTDSLDTSIIENEIDKILKINNKITIIIKSTIPFGFTKKIQEKYNKDDIIFCPEFLREGNALYDSLYQERIVMGSKNEKARDYVNILIKLIKNKNVKVKYMDSYEAESIKLFANTYLAMRVAFFNELDTFCELNNLNSKDIIEGISLDNRIGMFYNNPSFGYGGYCLPKDVKQLEKHIDNDSSLIKSISKSNKNRKKHIYKMILKSNAKVVGIYRLSAKKNTDDFRESAVLEIIKYLKKNGIKTIIYEPLINKKSLLGSKVINDLDSFKKECNIIIANRNNKELDDIKDKVYSRDIFNKD